MTQHLRILAAIPASMRQPGAKKRRAIIEATTKSKTRRLQEGSDVDGATVAHPNWTELSPLDDSATGDT